MERERVLLRIQGLVQGVGFRPHVFRLAHLLELSGSVCNGPSGVLVDVEGAPARIAQFCSEIVSSAPPAAKIFSLTRDVLSPRYLNGFRIVDSQVGTHPTVPVSPDLDCCPDCLSEILDPANRRFGYPFTNCTNCGPRFTIIQSLPYDRASTTMSAFQQCSDCRKEYENPADRRFHAQPNACPRCGPSVSTPLPRIVDALVGGEVVAMKGIGGYHLACDATDPDAVQRMRTGKGRLSKPFAVMVATLDKARELARLSDKAISLLSDPARPIVLLPSRHKLPDAVAPGMNTIGILLPYTPLHHLLLSDGRLSYLVMTSGNESGLPIVTSKKEAVTRLATVADRFLHHNRPIETPCDDSVLRVDGERIVPIRRSRGYAPYPLTLPFEVPASLAVGAQLKSSFALGRGRECYVSQHLGDLENLETLGYFERTLEHFKNLYELEPQVIITDTHPGYLSRRWAAKQGLPIVEVQHHHAHMASCMAENGLESDRRVLGVVLDGTGYGTDGTVWGGEILRGGYHSFERLAYLRPVPLPGGDKAVREPWRMALAHLWAAGIPWTVDLPPVRYAQQHLNVLRRQLERGLNTVPTSSAGRLFDAVASLLGLRHTVDFEAQAAMELESLAEPGESQSHDLGAALDPTPMLKGILADLKKQVPAGVVSMRFHRGLSRSIVREVKTVHRGEPVVLSGGVFQNLLLLELTVSALEESGIETLVHRSVPSNDGGISLGQLAAGATRYQQEGGSHVFRSAR